MKYVWHKLSDGDLPKNKEPCYLYFDNKGYGIGYFDKLHWFTIYDLSHSGHIIQEVIAWCELPKFKD